MRITNREGADQGWTVLTGSRRGRDGVSLSLPLFGSEQGRPSHFGRRRLSHA